MSLHPIDAPVVKQRFIGLVSIDGQRTVHSGDTELPAVEIAQQLLASTQNSCASQISVEVAVRK